MSVTDAIYTLGILRNAQDLVDLVSVVDESFHRACCIKYLKPCVDPRGKVIRQVSLNNTGEDSTKHVFTTVFSDDTYRVLDKNFNCVPVRKLRIVDVMNLARMGAVPQDVWATAENADKHYKQRLAESAAEKGVD